MTSIPDFNLLGHAEKDELICSLFVQLQELAGIVAAQAATIAELKGRLALNSTNSSKPPSSNGFDQPSTKNRSLRGKSGKNKGGQKGHIGNCLKQVEQPTHTEMCLPPSHCDCGLALGELKNVEARQVFDIPKIRPEVTEYQVYETRCTCGKVHRGSFPEGVVGHVQYGPVAKAMVVELTHHEMQPLARTGKLMGTIFDLPMSDATVLAIQKEAHWRLSPIVAEIAAALKAAPAIHADETGMYVAGKCQWMHVVATESLTWMGAHEKRGKVAFDDLGILAAATGVLIHDGLRAYRLFSDAVHGLCNQHHLRELLFVAEEMGQDWAKRMMELLRTACHEVNESLDKILCAERIAHFRLAYEVILQAGEAANPPAQKPAGKRGQAKQNKAYNLLLRLRTYIDDVWRFTENPHVPFTNNIAEQAVRMPKVKQKISGGFRTMEGLKIFCTIRSYLATLHKQGANIFDALIQTFRESPPTPRFA